MERKVIVITGASGGIGAALAELLAAQGHALVLVARRAETLKAVAMRCDAGALPIRADVTRREDVKRIVVAAIAGFGQLDVWVNNVGQGISMLPSQLTDSDIDEMMRINVKTALYGMQETLPHFKLRGEGHVINISSMLGRVPSATFRAAYSGAKHYLGALTASFRAEVQEEFPHIQYSLVSPGVVATDFGRNALHGGPDSRDLPGAQSPYEVAEVIARVVETRAPDAYTLPGAHQRVVNYFSSLANDA
jgi:short-subunit dehydrogenase